MKIKSFFTVAALMVGLAFSASAQKLPAFESSITKTVGPKTLAVPYTDVVTYLGYASPGNEDEVKDGKKFYYIYVWIPAVVPELGVRMMSPVGKYKMNKKATKSEEYTKNASSEEYFDTYITLEKSDILKLEDVTAESAKSATWTVLSKNDDSSKMPKQPSGSSYNSYFHYESEVSDPLKALTVGLYRVGFTTYKKGEVKGTFMAEVGSPVKIPGVGMAKTIDELLAALAK